jgi:hypothetical protein
MTELDRRLAELRERTAALHASPGFRARVLAAVAADAASAFGIELVRSARRLAPFAIALALLAAGLAAQDARTSSAGVAAIEETLVLSW